MNLFYFSENAEENAKQHCDKHTVKMILEYTQLLSTAHRVLDGVPVRVRARKGNRTKTIYQLNDFRDDLLYGATHINHPVAKWVRQSHSNYLYLVQLLDHLHSEYEYRYGRVHKSKAILIRLRELPLNIPYGAFTSPALAMPDEYKTSSATESYRNYFIGEKSHIASWKYRNVPGWYKGVVS